MGFNSIEMSKFSSICCHNE